MKTEYGKPNILFIVTDQQRADTIGPGRHPMANYPHMEKLAEDRRACALSKLSS